MRFISAERDPRLTATVVTCQQLLYREGPAPALDRPAHVRAGSGLNWFGDRLALIQDDANFLALIDTDDLSIEAITLPAGADGARQFDDLRGNKHLKLDLEASVSISTSEGDQLLAFGSGSSEAREQIAVMQDIDSPTITLYHLPALYEMLGSCKEFSGSELNLEGAIFIDGSIRLFNRGNGARRDEFDPINATCDLLWTELAACLADPAGSPAPRINNVMQYDLGSLDGLRLSFTDASCTRFGIIACATAEDSPDAIRDGRVTGSALVLLQQDRVRCIELRHRDGTLFQGKVEGVAASRENPNRVYVVVDADDPQRPSELCQVELGGPWEEE